MTLHRLSTAVELLRTNGPYRRYALARLSSTVGTTVAPLGLAFAVIGIGLACGSITSLLFPPGRVGLLLCVTPIPEALLLAGMASNAPLPLLASAAVLTGAAGTLQLIVWTSHLQEAIPAEQLSRIMATNAMIGTLLVPVAYSLAGPLADLVGVRAVLAGCAAVVVGGAAAAVCVRDVRDLNARG